MEPSALPAIDLLSLGIGGGIAAGSYGLGRIVRHLTQERNESTDHRLNALQASVTTTQHLNDERLRSLDQAMLSIDENLKKFSDWAEEVTEEMRNQRSMLLMVQQSPAMAPQAPAPVTPQDLQADMVAMQQMVQAQEIETLQTPLQKEFQRRMDNRMTAAGQGDPWNQQ